MESLSEILKSLGLERTLKAPLRDLGVFSLGDLGLLEDKELTGAGISLVEVKKLRRAVEKHVVVASDNEESGYSSTQKVVAQLQEELENSRKKLREAELNEEDNANTITALNEQVGFYKRRSEELSTRMKSAFRPGEGEELQKMETQLLEMITQLAEVKGELRNREMLLHSAKATISSLEGSLKAAKKLGKREPTSFLVNALLEAPPYGAAVDALITELGKEEAMTDPMILLPLLRGLLAEVVQREDYRTLAKQTKARSAFDRFGKGHGKSKAAGPWGGEGNEPNTRPGLRRWRRALRAIFNEDAAIALLDDILVKYRTEEFADACSRLNESWASGVPYRQQVTDIRKLCLAHGLSETLTQFGFSDGLKGVQEMESVIDTLSRDSQEIHKRETEVRKVLFSRFTRINTPMLSEGDAALNRSRMESVLRNHGHIDDEEDEVGAEDWLEANKTEKGQINVLELDGAPKVKEMPKIVGFASQARMKEKARALREEFPE